jgi:cytochrome c peroxidase
MHRLPPPFSAACLAAALALTATAASADPLTELGRALFFDTNLSEPRGQACATCHDPDRAFSDPRATDARTALSVGADGISLGLRNTPGLTYLSLVPAFSRTDGHYQGGLFLDGRAASLEAQVLEPLLNPLEMAMPDGAAVVRRVLENEEYRDSLGAMLGAQALREPVRHLDSILNALTAAIAAFERSTEFSTFDSKYDRYLRGEYRMTRDEAVGREVFFSGLVNCIQCHLNRPDRVSPRETFTNHRYHNIGVPVNPAAAAAAPDPGLAGHPDVGSASEAGRFRVPTLRNVAVTAPYMHNGVFRDLETAVAFYGKFTLRHQRNPETGQPWQPAEVPETVDEEILVEGQPIDPARVRHLTAFLKTLTDRRYEHLLD